MLGKRILSAQLFRDAIRHWIGDRLESGSIEPCLNVAGANAPPASAESRRWKVASLDRVANPASANAVAPSALVGGQVLVSGRGCLCHINDMPRRAGSSRLRLVATAIDSQKKFLALSLMVLQLGWQNRFGRP